MNVQQFRDRLSASGVRLSVTDGKLRVDAPAGALTPEIKTEMVNRKRELLQLISVEVCKNCKTSPMQQIEAGYYSCPACHCQVVEARSGFWTSGQSLEMKEAA